MGYRWKLASPTTLTLNTLMETLEQAERLIALCSAILKDLT